LAKIIKKDPGSGKDLFLALGVEGRPEELEDPKNAHILSVESVILGAISRNNEKKNIELKMWQNDPASVVYGYWKDRTEIWEYIPYAVRGGGRTLMAWTIDALNKGVYPDLKGAEISLSVREAFETLIQMGFESKNDFDNLGFRSELGTWTYEKDEFDEGLKACSETTAGILAESATLDPSAAEYLAKLTQAQGQVPDGAEGSSEPDHARGFTGFLRMAQANSGTKLAFIALGREWIDKVLGDHMQRDEVNSQIRAIRLYCESEKIPFFYDPKGDKGVIEDIKKFKSEDKTARGIVLAGAETITGIETILEGIGLKDDDRVTLAAVDGSRLKPDSFIQLVEMFEVLFELAVQPGAAGAIKAAHKKLKFETVGGRISRIIFIPDAEPLGEDIEEFRLRYRLQVAA
jgi:hypothetical protein